jgi:poly-gamma-glutamate synthesis protein (capsule biosynthesis protein)
MQKKWHCALAIMILLVITAGIWSNIPASKTARQVKGKEIIMQGSVQKGDIHPSRHDMLTLFLCGDVMPGRGIDQVLPYPSDPVLYESYVRDARDYVKLAEAANGPIQKPVDYAYIWGDGLAVLSDIKPDLRIINLETSVTTSNDFWPSKGINYRMHPKNIPCLSVAQIKCCILANNHVLDWGHSGLVETLDVLAEAGIKGVGAGKDQREAKAARSFSVIGKGRILVFAYGSGTSGIPDSWAATEESPGVNLLADLSDQTVLQIKKEVAALKQPGDVVLFSLHWGGNWGYSISPDERRFAHKLIDEAGVDFFYGHSSHHFKGIEVYQEKLILYGCGDFINDYEGIKGYERYRDDLTLMYFPVFDPTSGHLVQMVMIPMQMKRFQAVSPPLHDRQWIMDVLNREGQQLGTHVILENDGSLTLQWR